jgi:hypothetical protein
MRTGLIEREEKRSGKGLNESYVSGSREIGSSFPLLSLRIKKGHESFDGFKIQPSWPKPNLS